MSKKHDFEDSDSSMNFEKQVCNKACFIYLSMRPL